MKEKEDRRRLSRNRSVGEVEVLETVSGNRTPGRLVDLTLIGCRVYVGLRLPGRAAVRIRITRAGETFEAIGEVVWSDSQGTGIVFQQFSQEHEQLLEKWIEALSGGSAGPEKAPQAG